MSNTSNYALVAVLPGRLRVGLRNIQQELLEESWELISSVREPCDFAIANFRVSDDDLFAFMGSLRNVVKQFSEPYNGLYCNFRGFITRNKRFGARLAGGSGDIEGLYEQLHVNLESFMGAKDSATVPHVVLFGHISESFEPVVAKFDNVYMGGGVLHQFELRRMASCISDNGIISIFTI